MTVITNPMPVLVAAWLNAIMAASVVVLADMMINPDRTETKVREPGSAGFPETDV
jgi:hypothetical protein